HFPDRAARIMGRVRDLHGGQDYDPEWGKRLTGEGPFAQLITQRFAIATKRLGLAYELPPLRKDLFKCPARKSDQLSLF
ncbi:MAG: radical SAM protein, partial [Silicimonas sp.]|nr:radical SAM protein [Silicimonas sp.]